MRIPTYSRQAPLTTVLLACAVACLCQCRPKQSSNPAGGTWTDPATGLVWQDPPFKETKSWSDAVTACSTLTLDGHKNFRLPTIDELRGLVRGCDATKPSGACQVTAACSATTCASPPCRGCSENGGPASEGAYRDRALTGDYMTTWSSTLPPDAPGKAWTVGYGGSHVLPFVKRRNDINVRCVR